MNFTFWIFHALFIDWQVQYDFHYDKTEPHEKNGEVFDYKVNVVKKDEKENVFTVDGTLNLKKEFDNSHTVLQIEFLAKFNQNSFFYWKCH